MYLFLLSNVAVPIPKGKVFSIGQRIPGYVLSIPGGTEHSFSDVLRLQLDKQTNRRRR